MALDPIILLTIAALLLGATGALMVRSAQGARGGSVLWGWGIGFLTAAAGLTMVLAAPNDMTSPVRVLGNAMLTFGFGLVWAASRRLGRGVAPRPFATAAGALVWLGVILVFDPPLGWRIGISSAILAAYSLAAASELMRERSRAGAARRRVGSVLAAHGLFHVLRAVLGPSFGFAAWGPSLSQGWGGALGLETMLFAVLFGTFAIAMSRDGVGDAPHADVIEDALTGIGNRRALFGSGALLLEEAVAAGRPLALLLMDLDGFRAVNDGRGPAAGDRLLVAFARLAHDYLPPTSLVCRLGGDAFAAVLPGAAPDRARAVADELRSLFAHLLIDEADGPVFGTVSIGVAQAGPSRTAMAALLEAAGTCLAAAKSIGRDQVVHETDLAEAAALAAA